MHHIGTEDTETALILSPCRFPSSPCLSGKGFSGLHFRDLTLGDGKVNVETAFLAIHKGGDQNNARSIYLHVLERHLRFPLCLFLEMFADGVPSQGLLPDFKQLAQLASYPTPAATAGMSVGNPTRTAAGVCGCHQTHLLGIAVSRPAANSEHRQCNDECDTDMVIYPVTEPLHGFFHSLP